MPWRGSFAELMPMISDFIRFLVLVVRDGDKIPAGTDSTRACQSARPVLGNAVADAYHELGIGQAIMQHLI